MLDVRCWMLVFGLWVGLVGGGVVLTMVLGLQFFDHKDKGADEE